MGATVDDINFYIKKLMTNLNIETYKLDIREYSEKGDGFLGEIAYLTVSTSDKIYNLVVKSAQQNKELRKKTPIADCYNREIFLYSKVLPIFNEFQIEKGVKGPFQKFAKCFMVFDELGKESLIFDNLKKKGYNVHDRKIPMNIHHALMVFQNYGRFHALSFALRNQKPSLFKSISKNLNDVLGQFFNQDAIIEMFINSFKNVVNMLEKERPEIAKKFIGMEKEIKSVLQYRFDLEDKSLVIIQGDCWNNNFMFKYEDEKNKVKPLDMAFLDLQLSRLASPVFDLSYYLFTIADDKVLNQFDFLLDAYYQSMKEMSSQLGTNLEHVFPYKTLKEHCQKYAKFGLFMMPYILKLSLCDKNEVPDFTESMDKEGGLENMDVELKNSKSYDRRAKDVFLHFAECYL